MMKTQRSETGKNNLIEEGKRKRIDKIIRQNAMISFCLKCKKNTESINPRVSKNNNTKTMLLSKCAICILKNQHLSKKRSKWIIE